MVSGSLLYRFPAFVVAGVVAIALMLTILLAHAAGIRARKRRWRGDLGSLETMASGLLGLLLAFNFSIAQTRFDARQQVIVRESNAIGTAYLRCSILDGDDRTFCREQLRRYVAVRMQAYEALGPGHDAAKLAAHLAEGQRIQSELWRRVARVARDSPTMTNALLMSALNDVIDLDAERRASIRIAVPQAVSIAIVFVCLAWALIIGYASGARGKSSTRIAWLVVALLISLIFGIAVDFDRPRSGVITTAPADRSMEDLRRSVEEPPVD